jgi:hypothetical protein
MPLDEFEFRRVMRANLTAVETECDRVFTLLQGLSPDDVCRPYLTQIHESLSNVVGTMKENLLRLS